MTKSSSSTCSSASRTILITFSIIFIALISSANIVNAAESSLPHDQDNAQDQSSHYHYNRFKPNKVVIDGPLLTEKLKAKNTIIVDINGNGHFKSVQAAIDSVPDGNSEWVIIHVRKGVYREKVHIPHSKPYIFMRGNGKGKSFIVWSQSSDDNLESATFKMEAPNFIAFGISFKNDAPIGEAFTSQNQSVAAYIAGDKAAFYHCGFFSNHNTLFDAKGRHYFDACYIQGSIDFIFGRARSLYHDFEIFVLVDRRVKIHGSITAHHREGPEEPSGYVFYKGKVYGTGKAYLGRAKGPYSRVLFAESYLSDSVAPDGWTNWSYHGPTEHLYQAEYDCHGPGSGTAERADWTKRISADEAAPFVSVNFIDGTQWLPAWLSS
ncbi:hypothetical protein Cgig2_029110 [Carnegiea gigantea]|uniref:Pectinesterase n=1 Tax=Carnegiea gigantea TaxID=171969 RepID=A0A9Q1QKH1_9CARY|nr:hypothetical protein Cgig2_029110 [Carnegiea gigantea]